DGPLRADPAVGHEIAGLPLDDEIAALVGDQRERAHGRGDGVSPQRTVDRVYNWGMNWTPGRK
uniref:hypothetical protein n=1 Tax=Streptomyces griseoruber TaxID=1943 RepID=UPI000AEB4306